MVSGDEWARTLSTTGRVEFSKQRAMPVLVLTATVGIALLMGFAALQILDEPDFEAVLAMIGFVTVALFMVAPTAEYAIANRGGMTIDSFGLYIPGWPSHDIPWHEVSAVRAESIEIRWSKVPVVEVEVSQEYVDAYRAARSRLLRLGDFLHTPGGPKVRLPTPRGTAEELSAWLNAEALRRSSRAVAEQTSPTPPTPARAVEEPERFLAPEFPTTWLSEGYDQQEVDAFVASIRDRISSDPPTVTVSEIDGVAFTPRRFKTAYSMFDVDDYLDDLVHALYDAG